MLDTLAEELKSTRAFEDESRKSGEIVSRNKELKKTLSDAVDNGVSSDG